MPVLNITVVNQLPIQIYAPYLAQTASSHYGEGSYSSSVYNGEKTDSSGLGQLVNTGTVIGLTVTIGALLIFSAILVKVWRRPKKNSKKSDSQKTK